MSNILMRVLGTKRQPKTYLTFRKDPSETGTATMSLTIGASIASSVDIWYKTNTADWSEYTSGTSIELVDTSDYVMFWNKSSAASTSTSTTSMLQFVIKNGKIQASGNIDSMCNFGALSTYCYYAMFSYCTSLTQAPELPATTLANYCYTYMFYDCISLTTAPELPATTLADYCYQAMFCGCTSLTTAPELPATELARYCYQYMLERCTSLTQAPELPATELAYGCYFSMFYSCTSLTSAPELPATTLDNYCYRYMFRGCTKLSRIKVGLTSWSSTAPTNNWVDGVAATGTFECPSALNAGSISRGVSTIPVNWTIVTTD